MLIFVQSLFSYFFFKKMLFEDSIMRRSCNNLCVQTFVIKASVGAHLAVQTFVIVPFPTF